MVTVPPWTASSPPKTAHTHPPGQHTCPLLTALQTAHTPHGQQQLHWTAPPPHSDCQQIGGTRPTRMLSCSINENKNNSAPLIIIDCLVLLGITDTEKGEGKMPCSSEVNVTLMHKKSDSEIISNTTNDKMHLAC